MNSGIEERKRSRLPSITFSSLPFFFFLDSSFAYLSIQNFHAKKPGERRLRGFFLPFFAFFCLFCLVGLSINYSFTDKMGDGWDGMGWQVAGDGGCYSDGRGGLGKAAS